MGSVTPHAQPGNPQPRLFRLDHDQAIINRMGFNSLGVDAMRKRMNQIQMQGRIVIGEGERDEAPMLYIGEEVGTGTGPDRKST